MEQRKKIVYFTSRVPYPLEKGDKLRAYFQIRELSKKNDIILCCASDKKLDPKAEKILKQFVKEIYVYHFSKLSILNNLIVAFLSAYPFQVGYFFNSGAHYFFNQILQKEKPDAIFVQLVRMTEYVKEIKDVPKFLDYMDTLSMGMERRKNKNTGIKKLVFGIESKRLKRYEEEVYKHFKKTFIITKQDQESFDFEESKNIVISPNGVDETFFASEHRTEKPVDVLFTGNMSYAPNVGAAKALVNDILPLLKEEFPNVKIMLAGANPHPQVKALANENVEVTGWLDDIRDAYNKAKVFAAPLSIGTGLQNKLLEAMCMEIPCITSELANNALKAKHNTEVLIGNSPEEFASLILQCLKDQSLSSKIAKGGRNFVLSNYNWSSIISKMEAEMAL